MGSWFWFLLIAASHWHICWAMCLAYFVQLVYSALFCQQSWPSYLTSSVFYNKSSFWLNMPVFFFSWQGHCLTKGFDKIDTLGNTYKRWHCLFGTWNWTNLSRCQPNIGGKDDLHCCFTWCSFELLSDLFCFDLNWISLTFSHVVMPAVLLDFKLPVRGIWHLFWTQHCMEEQKHTNIFFIYIFGTNCIMVWVRG